MGDDDKLRRLEAIVADLGSVAVAFSGGTPITPEALAMVASGEDALRAMGFRQFRVRHHDNVARVELPADDINRALDLEGLRSGSLNEVLPQAGGRDDV